MAQAPNYILLKEVQCGMKNFNLKVIVLEVGQPTKTRDGHEVRTCIVSDDSGSMNLSVWGEIGKHIKPSDILRIKQAYAGMFRGCLTLYTGKSGRITKIGEFTMTFNEVPNFSKRDPEYLMSKPSECSQGKV